jgi:hypothetical protein
MTSLWRKKKTSDKVATDVHHNEQKPDHLVNILTNSSIKSEQKHDNLSDPLDLLHQENVRLGLYEDVYDLSIKSDNLSIKSEKAMREVQKLGQEIQREHMMWVDPPEGWKFGFPAIYDPNTDGQMSEWIVRKGYPLLTIKEYGDSWAVRCWPVEMKPSDESD